MVENFTAGERIAAPLTPERPVKAPKPPRPPKPKRDKPKGAGFSLLRLVGRVIGLLAGFATLLAIGGGVVGYKAYLRYSADLPDIETLRNYQPRVMSRVYAGDSRLLAELATERRIFVPIAAIPALVKQAFISAEDQNFYTHKGLDPSAIARAVITDIAQYGQGRRPVGASTITQQVAKNMLIGNEVSLVRKAREALMALRIEQSLDKDHILELYLNEIYLGLQAYGVAAAAQAYFNKSLDELSIQEAAFLAALPKAPNNYNPFRHPDAARARRDFVIDRMAADRAISQADAQAARAAPVLPAAFRRAETLVGGEYFTEDVRRWLVEKFGADRTTQGGLVVRTTLDPALQLAADKALRDGLMRYDQRRGGWRGPVSQMEVTPSLRVNWATSLMLRAKPRGQLPEWRTGVVLEVSDGEARIGYLERAPGAPAPTPKVLPVQLADLGWARPFKAGQLGPAPRKVSDVLQIGNVIMIEPQPATPTTRPPRPERALLRQVPAVQGALVSIEPATGRVLAMSGGWSFENSQFNRATQANRQPGSSFKPFVYLAALQAGISPSQRFLDAPFVVDQGAAGKWRPGNFELDFSGPVSLRVALEKSLNLVTVRVADRIGMEAVARTAIGFHMVDAMPRVLPAALGAVETTIMREAGAYAGLAAGGREVLPILVDSVQDSSGKIIWRPEMQSCAICADPARIPVINDPRRQVVDAASVFQVVTMMQGVVTRGTGTAAGAGLNRAIAGKTGTSQEFNDAWFGGFTPDLATVVWIGFDTPSTLGNNETGGGVAAPVWHDFMAVALKNRPNLKFIPPPGVTLASWDTGAGTVTDAFKPGQEPGASGPIGGLPTGATEVSSTPAPAAAGVDSGLGGLY